MKNKTYITLDDFLALSIEEGIETLGVFEPTVLKKLVDMASIAHHKSMPPSDYVVIIKELPGAAKIQCIKLIRVFIPGLDLSIAKEMVEKGPIRLPRNVDIGLFLRELSKLNYQIISCIPKPRE